MSFINYSSREINCKIVYYGPGLCGKTTNLQHEFNLPMWNRRSRTVVMCSRQPREGSLSAICRSACSNASPKDWLSAWADCKALVSSAGASPVA